MKLRLVCGFVMAVAGCCVEVRTQSAPEPKFEVASVKLNTLRTGIRGHSFPGDRFEAKNVPMRDLIMIAFGEPGQPLPDSQMMGRPSWIDSDRFDVSATVGADSRKSVADKQVMLRRLLEERFKFAVHSETKDLRSTSWCLRGKMGSWDRSFVMRMSIARRSLPHNPANVSGASCTRCRQAH